VDGAHIAPLFTKIDATLLSPQQQQTHIDLRAEGDRGG
jgi:hypothetical protein